MLSSGLSDTALVPLPDPLSKIWLSRAPPQDREVRQLRLRAVKGAEGYYGVTEGYYASGIILFPLHSLFPLTTWQRG